MWGYAITLVLALLVGAGPVLAETQSVIDPTQVPQPPKDPAATPKKPPQTNAAVLRERERAAAERRKREEAEARAQAAAKEAARLRAAEQYRQATEAARLRAAEQARAAEVANARAAATRQVSAAKNRANETERRKREAAEARAQAAERETAKLRAAEQARLEQDAALAAVEREAAAARIDAVETERRKREVAEARAQAAEKEIEKLRIAEHERRAAEQERRRAEAEREATLTARADWVQRLAVLERLRGQLNLARALAILLDVNQKEELAMLVELESVLKTDPWHSAYAMSVNQAGQLAAGRGWRSRTPELATVTAVSFCSKGGGESCRSVMVNGRFQENDFLEVARQFGKLDVVAVRGRYIKALRAVRDSSPWAYQSQDALPLSRLER